MTRPFIAAATLLALAACTVETEDDHSYLVEVLPDERVLISLPTSSASTARSELGEWSEFYVTTAEATENVNGLIRSVLTLLDTVVNTRPSSFDRDEHRAVWGPYSDSLDPVYTWVIVEYDPATDVHTWAFAQRPKSGEEGEEVVVIAGEIDAGATYGDHTGRFVMDYTAMAELDPTVEFSGIFYSDYDVDPTGVIAEATVEDWQNLETGEGPTDAGYRYEQDPAGFGSMDLAWTGDYLDDGTEDVYLLRSRWTPTGAGRGDAVLAEGGEDLVGAATECWDDSFELVYRAESWSGEEGEVSACVYDEPSYSE